VAAARRPRKPGIVQPMARRPQDPIERGWARLEAGDLEGARAALARARKADPDDPETLCLAGAVAAADDDVEGALALLAQAADADPDYAHPLLHAGELELYSRGDAETAAALATRALAVSESAEERT